MRAQSVFGYLASGTGKNYLDKITQKRRILCNLDGLLRSARSWDTENPTRRRGTGNRANRIVSFRPERTETNVVQGRTAIFDRASD